MPSSGSKAKGKKKGKKAASPRCSQPARKTPTDTAPPPTSHTKERQLHPTPPASSHTKGRQVASQSARPESAGACQSSEAAAKGKNCAVALNVGDRVHSAKTGTQKKMAADRGRHEEAMDWDIIDQDHLEDRPESRPGPLPRTSGASFDVAQLMGTPAASSSPGFTASATAQISQGGEGQGEGEGEGEGQDKGQGRTEDYSDSPDSDFEYHPDKWEGETQTSKPSVSDGKTTWKGVALHRLKTTPEYCPPDVKLERSSEHYVAVCTPFVYREDQPPSPYTGSRGCWDSDHVRMPFATESTCMVNGKKQRRWNVIVNALNSSSICGPFELEEAILKYNRRYSNKWKFTVLHHYFIKKVSWEEREEFFDVLLPKMIELALKLTDICPTPLPLLKKKMKLTLSQKQISCLLANAFFCTFPLRNARTKATEYADYPDINFSHLFTGEPVQRKLQKMTCIINYFRRVLNKVPTGVVTFSRQTMSSDHHWLSSNVTLSDLHVSASGTIEDNGMGMLQVDFANKFLGGGVLGHGCVQEEIRFLMCPEMIVTRLFTQALGPLDSLLMIGCERFNDYEGYSDTFRWTGDFIDVTPRDPVGRLFCEVVAIDAQVYRHDYPKQFKRQHVDRELNKAYCGFKSSASEQFRTAVCTGNWGCGAFGGDKQLKALIQVLSASEARRDVCYFTFDDQQLTSDLFEVHDKLKRSNKTVGDVYSLLEDYNRYLSAGRRSEFKKSLYEFILARLSTEGKGQRAARRDSDPDIGRDHRSDRHYGDDDCEGKSGEGKKQGESSGSTWFDKKD